MPRKIRILSVDDHKIVLDGLSLIVNLQPDMEIVGTASTGMQALELFRLHRPDVVLMDLRLGGSESGVEAIGWIVREYPNARVIALTMYQSIEAIHKTLKAGAVAYLSKDTPSAGLLSSIREVYAGNRPMDSALKARLEESTAQPALTRREVEIIELVSQGMRNKEIAAFLDIHEETVEVHLKNIFSKMNVHDRTAAMRVALQRGIIQVA